MLCVCVPIPSAVLTRGKHTGSLLDGQKALKWINFSFTKGKKSIMGSTMHYLAVGVGLCFVVLGLLKVAPIQPAHNQMVTMCSRHASVFPLKYVGIELSADMYRALIAVAEIMCGSLLAFGRYDWRALSCVKLLVISILAVYAMLTLGDPVGTVFTFLVLGGLLLVLLFHPNGFWGNRGKVHLA